MTGCEQVTTEGLRHLISGLEGVCFAVSFLGFRPLDDHVSQKMEDHCNRLSAEVRYSPTSPLSLLTCLPPHPLAAICRR